MSKVSYLETTIHLLAQMPGTWRKSLIHIAFPLSVLAQFGSESLDS